MKYRNKRFWKLAGCIAGIAAALWGCGKKEDPNTLTLRITSYRAENLIDGIKEKFPEINLEIEYYEGADTTTYLLNAMENDDATDLIFCTTVLEKEVSEKSLLDLSGYQFLGNFDYGVLSSMEKEGRIYQIPGPVAVRGIIYNKTLFELNGWKVPENFAELVEVVKQIRQDAPEVTPLAIGTYAPGFAFSMVSSFAQSGFLSTPDGADWEQRYLAGEASVEEGFDEGLTMVEQLLEADAFEAERYSDKWNVVDGDLCERKVAMSMVMGGMQPVIPLLEGTGDPAVNGTYCLDEYGMLPFFGLEDGDVGLSINIGTAWGLNKHLGEPGNEKKLENALKIMEFISSKEGQMLLRMDAGQIPVLKDLTETELPKQIQELWNLGENGHKSFYLYSGYEDIIGETGRLVIDYMEQRSAEGFRESFVELADKLHQAKLSGEKGVKTYGEISENLSIEQTGQLYMDAVQAKGMGDFTLATRRGYENRVRNKEGVGGKFYAGELHQLDINVGLAKLTDTVQIMELPGAAIKEMLNTGKLMTEEDRTYVYPYYWSGIEVSFKDGEVKSVKLNGEELEEEKIYKVTVLGTDYEEGLAGEYTITDTGVLVEDVVKEYLTANSPVSAPKVSER